MYNKKIDAQEYLSIITNRLKQQNYKIKENVEYKDQVFIYIARHTKPEFVRGSIITTFFVFSKFGASDIHVLKNFSAKAFNYSRKTRGIFPPRGFGYGFFCFPVAIVDSIDSATVDFVRRKEPPRHWAASEKLVIFSLESNTLYYCEETFSWGYLYYDWDRKIITEMLSL
jgi:hypothetical protein